MGLMASATWARMLAMISVSSSPWSSEEDVRVTKATMAWPVVSSEAPTTAASATAG